MSFSPGLIQHDLQFLLLLLQIELLRAILDFGNGNATSKRGGKGKKLVSDRFTPDTHLPDKPLFSAKQKRFLGFAE